VASGATIEGLGLYTSQSQKYLFKLSTLYLYFILYRYKCTINVMLVYKYDDWTNYYKLAGSNLGYGRHFSSGSTVSKENCHHPPPEHGRYLRVPTKKCCKNKHPRVQKTYYTSVPSPTKNKKKIMAKLLGLKINI